MQQSESAGPNPGNVAEYSVSEISNLLKRTVEDTFGHVRVRGEISGYRGPHSSGHCYFTLKDDRARLEAVIWRAGVARLKQHLQEGLEVVATGKLTTYPGTSKYQIVIEALEPAGAGALMALLEARKKKLAAEGLFDPAGRKPLPFLPSVIGVITSPTGAVIRDVLHRIGERFPLHVLVWPVRVQGETCGPEVAAAIAGFNALPPNGNIPRPDLIIVARGGGSIEDLWGFNDEAVARAAAASKIPLISAVGHETDWTLLDLVADLRAPTPTAAAELAVPVKAELQARIATSAARLNAGASRSLEQARTGLRAAERGLGKPQDLLSNPRQWLDMGGARLKAGLLQAIKRADAGFGRVRGRLSKSLLDARLSRSRERLAAVSGLAEAGYRNRIGRHRMNFGRISAGLSPARLDRITANARLRLDQTWRLATGLSHEQVLRRGFALIRKAAGEPVAHVASLAMGEKFIVQMQDGKMDAIAGGNAGGHSSETSKRARKSGSQGDLF